MSFLDNLFGASDTKSTTQTKLPDWINNAAKYNYDVARYSAERPYTPYPFARVAPLNADQNTAAGMLRDYKPMEFGPDATLDLPRSIDNIPGGANSNGQAGSIQDYMNPYIDQVLSRTQDQIKRATDMANQWTNNMGADQAGAFGDARHGVAQSLTNEAGIRAMGDQAAQQYESGYNNAQALRTGDINRMLSEAQFNRGNQSQAMSYIDALMKSGGAQQQQVQTNMSTAYEDYLRQLNYPQEKINMLVSALGQTPYGQSTTSHTPGPSPFATGLGYAADIASIGADIASMGVGG
jgi:hypothetical protein